MVSNAVIYAHSAPGPAASSTRSSDYQRDTSSSITDDNRDDRVACIRRQLSSSGFSPRSAELIINSWRAGTNKQYASAWSTFTRWCGSRSINPFQTTVSDVAEFLTCEFDLGKSYSTINTYRSALSSVLPSLDGRLLGQQPMIVRLLRGMYNERPSSPRYSGFWNVNTVLTYLKTLHPVSDLSLKLLTLKLNALLALISAQRAQTLVSLDTANLTTTPGSYHFLIPCVLKTSAPTKAPLEIRITRFEACDALCAYLTLREYLERTKLLRATPGCTKLLLSYVKPHSPISTDTCSRWLRSVLDLSGIDTLIFKGHSFRGAATSKAHCQGVSIDSILKAADWANEQTFARFYRRDINRNSFADGVLQL